MRGFEESPICKGAPLKSLRVRQILAELFELFSERLHQSDKIMARKNLLVQGLGWIFGVFDYITYAFYRRQRSIEECRVRRLVYHAPHLLQRLSNETSDPAKTTLPDSPEKEICRAVVVCRTFSKVQLQELAQVMGKNQGLESVDLETESEYSYNDPNLQILTAASLEKLVKWEKAHAEQSSISGHLYANTSY
jgi:hypothetical protein